MAADVAESAIGVTREDFAAVAVKELDLLGVGCVGVVCIHNLLHYLD